jgi:predicted nucleic acid-binding protein
MNTFLLDTSYLLALEFAKDQHHSEASAHWNNFAKTPPSMITTALIFHEVTTFFNNRGKHAKAVEIGERLLQSPSVELVHLDETLFQTGWEYFQRHQDKTYSFADCVSFVLMATRGLQDALAFDHHFDQAGFRRWPRTSSR